ncbi:MAG: hypothetical protein KF861_15665 [Planctomycetaceae bacterium]|nr:hypothetical protein [Planctomycetaceae bacterium]
MSVARIPLRVVFYYEEDAWVARCLEFDLIGIGESQEEALRMLAEAIELQAQATFRSGNVDNLYSPAEGKYLAMWARGRHLAVGELQIQSNEPAIEGIDAREFCDGGLQSA